MESRETDITLVQCEDCGWTGTVSECIHTYRAISLTDGDVEGIDECPKCGSENLIEPDEKKVLVGI